MSIQTIYGKVIKVICSTSTVGQLISAQKYAILFARSLTSEQREIIVPKLNLIIARQLKRMNP